MKISEKQLQHIIYFCGIIVQKGAILSDESKSFLAKILTEVLNQQSEELKEIDNAIKTTYNDQTPTEEAQA